MQADTISGINEVITDFCVIDKRYIVRNGFVFTALTRPTNVFDAIVIKHPRDAACFHLWKPGSERTLEEQIALINTYKLEKAVIATDCIDFITRCPTLKYIQIIPLDISKDGFDYSPLYEMPQIKMLSCLTEYGRFDTLKTTIDYSKISGLEDIHVTGSGRRNYQTVGTLKSLGMSDYKQLDLTDMFNSEVLDTLLMIQCKIKSLKGIERSKKMQCLSLFYNRELKDISDLRRVKDTLKALRIDNCPKIEDFSVLAELDRLEMLELSGKNTIPNLDFIEKLKNLKTFVFSMNVLDGDLSPCMKLSFVKSKRNRRHYNLKDDDLPKGHFVHGDESIELWRRRGSG